MSVEHVKGAQARFRARIGSVRWFYRDEIAAAARALASEIERDERAKAAAFRELAGLIQTPREFREASEVSPPSSSRTAPDRYSMPPDKEGDEHLIQRMNRCRERGGLR